MQGALEIGVAWRAETGSTGRGWLAAFGVLVLVAGVLVLFNPGGGVVALVWGLILWFVIAGVHDLLVGFSQSEHRGWNIVLGVLEPDRRVRPDRVAVHGHRLDRDPGGAGLHLPRRRDIGLALSMRRDAR